MVENKKLRNGKDNTKGGIMINMMDKKGYDSEEIDEKWYYDKGKNFIHGDIVRERLGISEKTLITLGESGEFGLGRVAGRIFVDKKSLLKYLDKCHLVGKETGSDETAYDNKGKIKKDLTYVREKHTTIPKLNKVKYYAEERMVDPMDTRNFIRHCDIGTFYHYRIGTAYKMSEDDWEKSLKRITDNSMKSSRGKRKPGRPCTVADRIPEPQENDKIRKVNG